MLISCNILVLFARVFPYIIGTIIGGRSSVLSVFVHNVKLRNYIYFIDHSNMGQFIQLPPFIKADESKNKKDIFQIKITDLNQDNDWRSKLVSDLNYLPEYKDKTEEKDNFLREQCVIEIYQNFIIEFPEVVKGFKIKVDVDENELLNLSDNN